MTRPAKNPGYSALQGAIYSALTASALAVYDEAGENLAFPYLTIGESSAIEAATKTENADEHIETLHVWSRYKGFKECKDLAASAIQAVSGYDYSSVIGYNVRFLEIDGTVFMRDPDGLTRHGVVRLKFKVIQE